VPVGKLGSEATFRPSTRYPTLSSIAHACITICRTQALSESAMTETSESQFRAVRIMHRIMLVAVVLYVLTAERLAKRSGDLPTPMTLGLGVTAIAVAIVALGYRMKMLPSAIESLRRNPHDTQALLTWRQAHILNYGALGLSGAVRICLAIYGREFLASIAVLLGISLATPALGASRNRRYN
jgi:hypothetical protein